MRTTGAFFRDNRWLQWVRYGEQDAPAIVSFHGSPGSRFEAEMYTRAVQHFGVQVVCVSRPGFGLSTWQPKRSVLDFMDDLAAFTDAQGIGTFGVSGYSAGGAYALAAASRLTDRVTGAGLLAPAAPREFTGMLPGPSLAVLTGATAGLAAVRSNRRRRHRARGLVGRRLERGFNLPDASGDAFLDSVLGAFRRGPRGVLRDLSLVLFDWGFDPADLDGQVPVTVWQGKRDLSVPWRGTARLAERIPNSTFHLDPTANHFTVYTRHADEIIETLAGYADRI